MQAAPFYPDLDGDNQHIGFRNGRNILRLGHTIICMELPLYPETQARLVSSSNPNRDVTINELDIGALLMHILIFVPRMESLAHIHTYVNNTGVQG